MNPRILEGPKVSPNSYLKLSLGQFFFDTAAKFQDKICQIDAITNNTETFSSVKQRSVRVALEMQNRGITSKDVIVTCSTVTFDTPTPVLAAFYLGAKVANLDPTLSVQQTSHMLSIVSPSMIFVEEPSLPLIEKSVQKANLKTEIVVFGKSTKYSTFSDFNKPNKNENSFQPVPVDIYETGLMFFSSGTTGLPKAICHSHFSFLNLIKCFCESGLKLDVCLSFTTFYWITGIMFLTTSFLRGGTRVIFSNVPDAQKIFETLEKHKVTLMFLAPVLTLKLTNFENSNIYDTSSLHSIMTGGTTISELQMRKISSTFKHSYIICAYGMTESGMIAIFDPTTDKNLIMEKLISCGKAAMGLSVKVVDVETRKLLGPNQKGEICVKTPFMMNGYYKLDCSDIYDEDGFLKTGDVGYYDDEECLYVVERIKEMFKYLSWHIVPSVIEKVLVEHSEIKEAAVFGIPVSEEEGEMPAACVVLKKGSNISTKEIEEFVASKVSDRERLRGGVFIVSELPRTPSGKLKRKEVRDCIIKFLNDNKKQ